MTLRPSFDAMAPYYQFLERITYGPLLHRCRTAHLAKLLDRTRALVLGDGDGRFLADLLAANLNISVDSIDLSAGMIALARRRAAAAPDGGTRVTFVTGDARVLPWPRTGYDLIVTNFFLDCFPPKEIDDLAARLAAVCTANAFWLDGDFRLPQSTGGRMAARAVLAGMYAGFRQLADLRVRQLADSAACLTAHGFELAAETSYLGGFISSRLWLRSKVAAAQMARSSDP